MRCYRSVHNEFGTEERIFSGAGAASTAGRWNYIGERIIYNSTTVSAAVSERAYHSMLGPIRQYNDKLKESGKNIPQSYIDSITNVEFKLGQILIFNPSEILNFKDQNILSQNLKLAKMSEQTVQSARLDNYRVRKQFWTRDISQFLNSKKVKGFVAHSARTDAGDTLVIFEENIDSSFYKIEAVVNLTIAAIDTNNKNLKKGQLASESHVSYTSSIGSGIAEVLRL